MEVSREEAKRILRRLELEAYSSIVSTFRAQGDLNREKKKLLTDLGVHLSISTERHRAEVRRAFSDDRLGAVADCIVGPSTCSEWAAEGRRLVPLMPRLVPQTILSGTATASANAAAAANAQVSAHVKKTAVGSNATSTSTREASSISSASGSSITKQSPVKQLSRQSSETVDVEYDSDDNKAKKKRKLSQSVAAAKPSPKMLLNPPSVMNKQGTKTASVSTSTMTKVGKQPATSGNIKATQKLMLPASASQVKLLTKTVSITQTVCQAKTVLNYKTVAPTNPGAVKVQTVMSHVAPKPQVKVAVPSVSKNVLIPKTSVSTSPSKPVAGTSPLKAGITMSQLAAKQRGKQTTRFKPLPGTVKYKSVTPATMETAASAVTMATINSNITTLTSSTISSVPNTQPIVRVIQVPSTVGVGINKPMIVMTTGPTKPTVSVSSGTSIMKIPISSTTQAPTVPSTTLAGRISSQAAAAKSIITSAAKTVVMSTIVGGTKKVVLSVPAPVTPIQAKPSAVVSTAKLTGIGSQLSQSSGDANKLKMDKTPGKTTTIPSLECTETSSFLQAPAVVAAAVPKTLTASTVSSQVRTRPLQTLLPAPPKPVAVAPATGLSSASAGRKLPQILPAPAKTTVLVPLATPPPQTVCTTSTVVSTAVVSTAGGDSKVPVVQFMAKPTHSTVVSKLNVTKGFTSPCTSVTLPGTQQVRLSLPHSGLSQHTVPDEASVPVAEEEDKHSVVPDDTMKFIPSSSASLPEIPQKHESLKNESGTGDNKPLEQGSLKADQSKVEVDNNISSEDDSLLVCSETIDSGAGLHDAPLTPEEVPLVDRNAILTSSPVEPLKTKSNPSKSMSTDIVNIINSSENVLSRDQLVNFPTKNTQEIPGTNNFLEDFLDEANSVSTGSLQENNQAAACEKVLAVSESTDFVRLKELDKKNTIKLQGGSEDLKNFAIDDSKDFDAVSSFLQSFVDENLSDQNLKESSEGSSTSSISLECKELQDVNHDVKLEHKRETSAELQQKQEKAQQVMSKSKNFSEGLDINEISLTVASSKPENSSLCELNSDRIDFQKLPSLKELSQSLTQEHTTSSGDTLYIKEPVIFGPSTVVQSSDNPDHLNIKDLVQCSSEQIMRDLPQVSVTSDIVDNMLAQSSSTVESEQGLTESERLALEAIANVRTSGRKRKPPSILTLSPPRQTSGWIRGALSLLQKVCSYRGQGRKKGDYSAVSWFLRPVDPNEAPGYFKVIKTPMDFSTIKSKLEAGMYKDYVEFHEDMMLIKTNCFKYNPPGHDIRKDCEEVFRYFDAEYEKMLERWEKCHVSPAKKPRTMPKSELTTSMSC